MQLRCQRLSSQRAISQHGSHGSFELAFIQIIYFEYLYIVYTYTCMYIYILISKVALSLSTVLKARFECLKVLQAPNSAVV